MVHVATASGTFHARVIAARLGAEGIPAELRGASDGIYPLPGAVDVYVDARDAFQAREILIGDEVDAIYEDEVSAVYEEVDPAGDDPGGTYPVDSSYENRPRRRSLLATGAVAIMLGALLVSVIVAMKSF